MTVAYLINQYPKVSHSFIRREIEALELQGLAVQRYALRGWGDTLADPLDVKERERVHYVLQGGALGLLSALLHVALRQPWVWLRTLVFALHLSRGALRGRLHHLAWLAEACWLRRELAREAVSPVSHLHAHFGTNAATVALLLRRLGGPSYSFTVHGPEEFDAPLALKLKEKAADAAFVVAISSFGRGQLMRWLHPADWPKLHVVHCGLGADSFPEVSAVSPASRRFVCVGRLCEQKAQLLLIEAMALLNAEGIEAELVLAGDGEMRSDIEAAIARHGLQQRVRITGWISSAQVREELLQARALVLPSVAEGLPVVLMEAMALRRPVLTTFIAGIPELVQPGQHGWLFPSGDAQAVAAAMRHCLAADASTLQTMGDAARSQAVARHSIATEAVKLLAHFERSKGAAT
jgi:colanic acid/amylovoran biosynthesis glycosyltransferase